MHAITRTAIAATLVAVAVPASAANTMFSAKSAYGTVWAYNYDENSNLSYGVRVSAYQNTNKNGGAPQNAVGADVSEDIYDYNDGSCKYGYGSIVGGLEFKASPSPNNVNTIVASGTVVVDLYDCYSGSPVGQDSVTFSLNLTRDKPSTISSMVTYHFEYGKTRVNQHDDYTYSPASVNASSVSSTRLGPLAPTSGEVGQSKTHSMEIIK